MTLSIPMQAVDQHLAILGKTGSGKTWAAKGIVEWMLDDKRQVCVIDPTAAWWGLRLSKSGKRSGYPIVLVGGKRADVPLSDRAGEAVARLVTQQHANVIIDTSGMTVGQYTRWFIDFAGTLYTTLESPLHLVIDEAHYFMPESGGGARDVDRGRMLHAGNRLMSGGRSLGIRGIMITQRPAKLHKDSLTCADTLIAMRVIAPQDRKAIQNWIEGCGDTKEGKDVVDSLAGLKRGQGYVWYPEGDYLRLKTFPEIKTYDSSAAPKHGEKNAPEVSQIDLEAVKAAMQDAIEEAERNDPALLRKQIAELQKQLAAKHTADPQETQAVIDMAVRNAVEQDRKVQSKRFDQLQDTVKRIVKRLSDIKMLADVQIDTISEELPKSIEIAKSSVKTTDATNIPNPVKSPKLDYEYKPVTYDDRAGIPRPIQKILNSLAWWNALGVEAPLVRQVAFVAGYKPSGTFSTYLSNAATNGLIDRNKRDGRIRLTGAGSDHANHPGSKPTQTELNGRVLAILSGPQQKIMQAIIEHQEISTADLASATNYAVSGTFSTYLSSLSSLGLINRNNGMNSISEAMLV